MTAASVKIRQAFSIVTHTPATMLARDTSYEYLGNLYSPGRHSVEDATSARTGTRMQAHLFAPAQYRISVIVSIFPSCNASLQVDALILGFEDLFTVQTYITTAALNPTL